MLSFKLVAETDSIAPRFGPRKFPRMSTAHYGQGKPEKLLNTLSRALGTHAEFFRGDSTDTALYANCNDALVYHFSWCPAGLAIPSGASRCNRAAEPV